MNTAKRKPAPLTAHQEVARVLGVDAKGVDLVSPAGPYRAKRAASCLLAPEVGDEVLVAVVSGGACYVIAVLEREAGAPSVIEVDGDLSLRASNGRVAVAGATGLDLVSGAETNLIASDINLRASRSSVVLEELALLAGSALAEVKAARLVADTIDSVADRLIQRVKRAYRFVEGVEHVRAEQLDYQAKKELCMRAENAVIMAEELVKVDGAQIHVG